jgi:hypothetical protein
VTASIIPSDLGIRGIVDAHLATKPAGTRAWDSYTEAHREADRADGIEGLLGDGLAARNFSEATG